MFIRLFMMVIGMLRRLIMMVFDENAGGVSELLQNMVGCGG